METISLNKMIWVVDYIFRALTVRTLGAQKLNDNLFKLAPSATRISLLFGIQQPAMVYRATVYFVSKIIRDQSTSRCV
jgi:hypothetical protein